MAEPERLSAAQRSKIRRLSQPKELAPDEEGGELNIVTHPGGGTAVRVQIPLQP